MPKLPRISSREAIRALERLGFEQVRQTGSDEKGNPRRRNWQCSVHRELKVGTLSGILKQAQATVEEFIESL